MASSDARPVPMKNTAFRITFYVLDADGDLVSGATGLDSEVSIDGGTFADCTNEATEIATASGVYFLDLTAAEMNGDTIAIITKTTSSGAKTSPTILYPEEAGDIRVNLTQWSGAAPSALISGRVDSSTGAMATNVLTATAINADAITAAKVAADVTTEIQAGLATAAALATVQTDTDDIQARLPTTLSAGRIRADTEAVSGDANAGTNLRRGVLGNVICTVGASSTTTSVVTSSMTPAAVVTDQFKGRVLTFERDTTTANLRGQGTDITANTAAGVLTVTALTTAPVSGDLFTIT